MAGNNNTKNDSTQKIVTKYDKKMGGSFDVRVYLFTYV